ncbi:hypothetical protein [Flavobacterium granuli]|uniref:DUF4134 domain-containing protein n=1 Tax=Flavobacterium granuli TaxID=280093 RepID=A0A1M5MQ93_9FLAO|nr:hypothetical protein [Flavobacterium granuli]PRZ25037.1 hypothetical protein BC624_103113 [Flavobacterium granuli]SHG79461.1 hypothetical protein SAMN05443373_104112 [Flavobacterium granuli]
MQNTENRMAARSGKSFLTKFSFALFAIFFSVAANAQCAMCRAALGGDANTSQAQAVNDGIVYLMAIPYLLVAVIGYSVYRMRKKKSK